VSGKPYTFEQRTVPFSDLVPDTSNPRYAMYVSDGPVSDEEMLNKLRAESQHKYLVGSIRENEGLIEPVYVREEAGGKRRVYEGNRRWAALHDLNEEDATAFGRVPVYVIPSDMGNEAWLKYLGILHDQGKTPWGGYSRAVYIRSMQNSGISVNEIAAFTGRSKADVTRAIATTGLVEEYAEYAKNKEQKPEEKYAQLWEIATMGMTKTKIGKKAAFHCILTGQVKSAKDIRHLRDLHRDEPTLIPKIAAGQTTLSHAMALANNNDTVGGSDKRFKSVRTTLTSKYEETKRAMVNKPSVFKEAVMLHKLLDSLISTVKMEMEDSTPTSVV
jgi:hypothetical protein